MTDRVLPHSLEAEKATLGAVLMSPTAWPTVVCVVRESDFFRDAHRRIFAAMAALVARGAPVDALLLADELSRDGRLDDVGGMAYIMGLMDGVPRSANAQHYAVVVRDKARLRALVMAAGEVTERAYGQEGHATEIAEDAIKRLMTAAEAPAVGLVSARAATQAYVDALMSGSARPPVMTGFVDLDRLVGGFRPSELVIVAARPSVGKSTFTLGASKSMATGGMTTVFFSMEMPPRQLAARLLSWESDVPASEVERGTATEAQFAEVHRALLEMPDIPLLLESQSRSVLEIGAWCRRLRQDRDLACVVIDYLQLLAPSQRSGDGEQDIAAVVQGLKDIAMELDIVVVALSQLNRTPDARRDKRPHLADLRGSGTLEQVCDLAILLFREEMHVKKTENAGLAEAIVAKNRNGPTGVVRLQFDHRLARFNNLAQDGTFE